MRLATQHDGSRDGSLVLVTSAPGAALKGIVQPAGIRRLQDALDDWDDAVARLGELDDATAIAVDERTLAAPLRRAYQWTDSSSYLTHMERIRASRNMALPPDHGRDPLVYQSGSDHLLGPFDDVVIGEDGLGLDLEATIAVITGDVPMGTTPAEARDHIRLVLLTNDYTFRHVLPREYAKSVGPYQAKPARPYAPFALTPDELGAAWDGGKLHATVRCWVDGALLGAVNPGDDCAFDFADVIAFLARTRSLGAGSMIGSGTVSNRDPTHGFGCLAEKRAQEIVDGGAPTTPLLEVGNRVRIEAFGPDGHPLFGAIENAIVGVGVT
jgi:fumarylacetoacetate (FAA) hydrolase